jgi:hypothetical protein
MRLFRMSGNHQIDFTDILSICGLENWYFRQAVVQYVNGRFPFFERTGIEFAVANQLLLFNALFMNPII